jgi:hypothetical protein
VLLYGTGTGTGTGSVSNSSLNKFFVRINIFATWAVTVCTSTDITDLLNEALKEAESANHWQDMEW